MTIFVFYKSRWYKNIVSYLSGESKLHIMSFKILLSRSKLRSTVLKNILHLTGFKIIRDHWVYTKKLNNNSVIIDLGANTGMFSEMMINKFKSQCFAVEPNKELFERINNRSLTKLNLAITKKDGPVEFYISENHEASSLINNFQTLWKTEEKQTAEGICLNTLLQRLNFANTKIDVLKMDIEGAELDIIESLNYKNSKNIQQITVEFHYWIHPESLVRTKQSINKLLSLGYSAIANTISPSEILFFKKKYFQFNSYQRVLFYLYNKLSFKLYEK